MRRTLTTTMLALGAVGALVLPGCGDDDDSADATTTTAAEQDAPNGEEASADTTAFCEGVVAGDMAFGSEQPDPEAATAALDEIEANMPADVQDAATTVVEGARAQLESQGEDGGGEEFDRALSEVHEWMGENCGYEVLEVTAEDYSFQNLPETVESGTVILHFVNEGTEAHELSLNRINDDVDASVEELIALPEEEAMSKVTPAGGVFATPGGSGWSAAKLEPGRYAAVCFIPEGATMENMPALESGEMEGGQPHAMLGMTGEITVT